MLGRVEFLYMHPMSFLEFLEARGEGKTIELINSIRLNNPIDALTHQKLIDFVRDYFLIGGMPEVVKTFVELNSFEKYKMVLERQIIAFQQDFGKYSKRANPDHLKRLFQKIPELVGSHFKYSKIDPHASNPARDYKLALRQLELAGLIYQVHDTQANDLPLQSEANEKKFKTFLLDIGLLQCSLEVDEKSFRTHSLLDFFQGSLAEQFVAEELIANASPYSQAKLYFWENTQPGSTAEVDFVTAFQNRIVPIEVKSGKAGKLRSLKSFMEFRSLSLGCKISEAPLTLQKNILNVPFYLLSHLERLIKEAEFLLAK